jgi:tetratricopeptide (TPR) repeat protein
MDKESSVISRIKDRILLIFSRFKKKMETSTSEDREQLIDREVISSEKREAYTSISEVIGKLLEFEEMVEESREGILNKLSDGINGLEAGYNTRLIRLERSIEELKKEKEEEKAFDGISKEEKIRDRDSVETVGTTSKEKLKEIVDNIKETEIAKEIIQKYGYAVDEKEKLREDMIMLRWFLRPRERVLRGSKKELEEIRGEEKQEIYDKIALKHLDEMENLVELNIQLLFPMGVGLLRKKKFERACEIFNCITTIDNNLRGAWLNKGVALGNMTKYEKEIECYDKAIHIDGNYASAWYNKGIALKKLNNASDAKKCFKEAKRIKKWYLFSWDNVPGTDSEKLIRHLRDDFHINWAENAKIRKQDGGKIIRVYKDENSAELIRDKKEKAILKINGSRIYDLKIKGENGKLNIYKISKLRSLMLNLRALKNGEQ